jgi:hypothetical protein
MKQRILRLVLVVLAALALAGCGGGSGTQPDSQPPASSDY